MAGFRWSTLALIAIIAGASAVSCAKQPPPQDDRDRAEPPPTTVDTTDTDAEDAARRAAEEARLARDRSMATIGEMVFFEFDRSDLSDEARETLRRKADVLRAYPDIRIRIEGHADERGTIEYNLALGERRAETSRQYVVDLGIDPDRLTTISYGEERPLVDESNEAAWRQNRRDEFIPL